MPWLAVILVVKYNNCNKMRSLPLGRAFGVVRVGRHDLLTRWQNVMPFWHSADGERQGGGAAALGLQFTP